MRGDEEEKVHKREDGLNIPMVFRGLAKTV